MPIYKEFQDKLGVLVNVLFIASSDCAAHDVEQ